MKASRIEIVISRCRSGEQQLGVVAVAGVVVVGQLGAGRIAQIQIGIGQGAAGAARASGIEIEAIAAAGGQCHPEPVAIAIAVDHTCAAATHRDRTGAGGAGCKIIRTRSNGSGPCEAAIAAQACQGIRGAISTALAQDGRSIGHRTADPGDSAPGADSIGRCGERRPREYGKARPVGG